MREIELVIPYSLLSLKLGEGRGKTARERVLQLAKETADTHHNQRFMERFKVRGDNTNPFIYPLGTL